MFERFLNTPLSSKNHNKNKIKTSTHHRNIFRTHPTSLNFTKLHWHNLQFENHLIESTDLLNQCLIVMVLKSSPENYIFNITSIDVPFLIFTR